MKVVNGIALALVIIGGLNWGLVGVANLDLVAAVLGAGTIASKVVYTLVGIAAIYSISFFKPVTNCVDRDRSDAYVPPAQTVR